MRPSWGGALLQGARATVEARPPRHPEEATTRTLSIPGEVVLDASSWSGEVELRAFCELAVLEESPSIRPPYPERVELVLEPRSKLVVEILEVEGARAEFSALLGGDEDLGAARDDGRWRLVSEPVRLAFPCLRPGPYRLQLIPVGEVDPFGEPTAREPGPRQQVWVDLGAGETRTVSLPNLASPEVHVTGVLSWPGGVLPGHSVTLRVEETGHVATAKTGGDGRFELDVVGSGPGEVEVRAPRSSSSTIETHVPVTLPDTSPHVMDIELGGGGIEGRVVLPQGVSLAMPGHGVTIARVTQGARESASSEGTGVPLDEDGRYRLVGVQPGTYRVSVVGPNPFVAASSAEHATAGSCSVQVEDRVVRAPDIVVQSPVYVSGQLVRSGDDEGSRDAGSVSILVREEGDGGPWRMIARTQGDLSWESYLAPGRYQVRARGNHPIPLATPTAQSWSVVAGGPPLTLSIVPATARAKIRVLRAEDGHRQRFLMELRESGGDHLPTLGDWSTWRSEHYTGSLVPGSYVILVQPEAGAAFERSVELPGGELLEIEIVGR